MLTNSARLFFHRGPLGATIGMPTWMLAIVAWMLARGTVDRLVIALLPSHSANRHDAGCGGAGADCVGCERQLMPTDDRSTRLRFSLKTLLIAMTLLAVVLGAIAYLILPGPPPKTFPMAYPIQGRE